MKNKIIKKLAGLINQTCVLFTCIVFAFYIFTDIVFGSGNALTLKLLFLLFLLSLWFALTDVLLTNKKLNIFLRVSLHFISSTVGFYLIFIYLSGRSKQSANSFVLVIFFAAAYIIIASTILFIRHLRIKKKQEKEEYKSVYNKEN